MFLKYTHAYYIVLFAYVLRFDMKAIMLSMEYMTTPDSSSSPSEPDRLRYGPNVLLRGGAVAGV